MRPLRSSETLAGVLRQPPAQRICEVRLLLPSLSHGLPARVVPEKPREVPRCSSRPPGGREGAATTETTAGGASSAARCNWFSEVPQSPKAGNAGLGIAIAYLSRIGVDVAIPLTDTQRYDLIVVHEKGLERVQVKTTTMKDRGPFVVHLRTIGGNKSQVKTRPFDPSDYEWLFVVCGDATAYMIPTTEITARQSLSLGRRYEAFRLED